MPKTLSSVRGSKIETKTATEQAANIKTTTTAISLETINNLNTAVEDISSTTTMQAVKIKKELPSDEIKEFAENTMNELLGWYGFDGVDRLDLSTKTSRLLQSAAVAQANNAALSAANSHNNNHHNSTNNNNNNNNNSNTSNNNNAISQQRHNMEKRRSRSRAATLIQQQQQQSDHIRNIINNNNNNNNNNSASNKNVNNNSRKIALNCGSRNYRNTNRGNISGEGGGTIGVGVGSGGGGESTTSDHDTPSSREEDSKSPISAGKNTILEEKIDLQNCCWCRRPVPENAPEFLTTSDGPRYCSESCFTQSRRASFKKAKTCDWCKHVRHAISYVDFQDGASQLQFCSDKCLNQYKMQIFCKETQAHLDMNPHLREQGLEAVASGNGAGLITPDLWLRNCRSRSASPASTLSVSPGPTGSGSTVVIPNNISLATGSSSSPASSAASNLGSTNTPLKPMISVAPVSKLMSKSVGMLSSTSVPTSTTNRVSPKHNRKKRPLRSSMSGSVGAHHSDMTTVCVKGTHNVIGREVGNLSGSTASTGSGLLSKAKSLIGATTNNNVRTSPGIHLPSAGTGAGGNSNKSGGSVLSQFAGSSVQDLHMSVPPLSPMLEQQTPPHALPPHTMNTSGRNSTTIPPSFFATPSGGQMPNNVGTHQQLPHGTFPPHPPHYLPNPGTPTAAGMLPRFFGAGGIPGYPLPPHMVQAPPDLLGGLGLGALLGGPPPVTVMVPYPIVIPLPIPIPVPLPVMDFYKAYLSPEERAKLKEKEECKTKETGLSSSAENEVSPSATTMEDSDNEQKNVAPTETMNEEPLDFTKSKDCLNAQDVEDHCVEGEEAQTRPNLKRAASEEYLTPTTTLSPTTTTTTTTAVTPSPEDTSRSPATPTKATHCIVRANELETPRSNLSVDTDDLLNVDGEMDDAKQKLPKFKITRLQTKRTLIQTKESPATPTTAAAECSRPLRKRKRIIDCDFQKLALKEAAAAAAAMDEDGDGVGDEVAETLDVETAAKVATVTSELTTACNSNTKTQSKK